MPDKRVRDMTEGVIWKHLVYFSLPLFIGYVFQQLYNTVDSVVVGNYVGPDALAAVTSSLPVIFTLIGLLLGFSTGASVLISQHFGAHDWVRLRRSIHTSVLATVVMSLGLSLLGYWLTPFLLRLMNTPESVMSEATLYLQIYFVGLVGLMLYNMGSAILRAIGDSQRPLLFLILSSILNVVLDLVLVIRFRLGVAGVGYATIFSQLVSGLLIFRILFRSQECYSMSWKELSIDPVVLKKILWLGLPTGIQMAVTSFSNIFVQAYINAYGAASTAGWGIYSRIDAFVFLPIQSLALAITTFVGQNAGAQKIERVRKGVRDCMALSVGLTFVIVIGLYISADFMVSMFTDDPEVLAYGLLFLQLNSAFDFLNVSNLIHAGALRGVGDAKTPMLIMLGSFVVSRQIYLFIVSRLTDSIHPIVLGYPVGWLVCTFFMFRHFIRSDWEKRCLREPEQ